MKIKKPKTNPIKKIFCIGTESEVKKNIGQYATMLGLNKAYSFALTKTKVSDEPEFQTVCSEAEDLLRKDFIRFNFIGPKDKFPKIPGYLKKNISGKIGSMTIVADDEGKLTVRFHKRNSDGYWDNETKKYPEKETSGKWKHEILFILDEEDDEEE